MAHDRLPLRLPSPRARRSALSPAARSLRLQRIFARLLLRLGRNRGRGGLFARAAAADHPRGDGSRPRPRRAGPQADEIARLTPALRLAADGVAQGDTKYILLIVEYYRPTRPLFRPPSADRPRRVPIAPCQLSKCLKTLKTARASYWLKLASIWDRRHVRLGSAPHSWEAASDVPLASQRAAPVAARTSGGRPLCVADRFVGPTGAPSRRAKPTA